MPNDQASAILRSRLSVLCGNSVPGCIFHITRNGEPYADASFGFARLPDSTHGGLRMNAQTLVHTGSVGKFLCAVAILRLLQECKSIFDQSARDTHGRWTFRGQAASGDAALVNSVLQYANQHGTALTLDAFMFPLVQPLLNTPVIQGIIDGYRHRPAPANKFPGNNVERITLRQLLNHTSGLTGLNSQGNLKDNFDDADLGGATRPQVHNEPADGGPTTYDLPRIVAALLRPDAVDDGHWRYNNSAFTVLGAIIKTITGREYAEWAHDRLFSDPRFSDIARRPVDPARAARYYVGQDPALFGPGNPHPDYTNFSAAGGWYMSAAQICDWLDTVMQKRPIAGRSGPILDNPQALLDGMFGFDEQPGGSYRLGRLSGATKNGAASPAGGTTAILAFLRGYGDERVCVFCEVNAYRPADQLMVDALPVLSVMLGGPPAPSPSGLFQTVYWQDSDTRHEASQVAPVEVRSGIRVGGNVANRTDLLGNHALAGGRGPNDLGMAELRGLLSVPATGAYEFRLSSEDGSSLTVDGQLIINSYESHPLQSADSAAIQLLEGHDHAIRVQWFNANVGGPGSLYLQWKIPAAVDWEAIPSDNFSPA